MGIGPRWPPGEGEETLPCGIYALDPFARYLEATFAAKGLSNSFEGLRHALYIPAIDLETGQSVVFGDEGWREVPISKAVTASSAAPIYFCPVRIGGREYVDAGIGRFDCFDLAAQKAADLMMMIHPSPLLGMAPLGAVTPTNRSPNPRHRGFLSISDLASRINLEARFRLALDLNRREHPGKFFVISPDPSQTSKLRTEPISDVRRPDPSPSLRIPFRRPDDQETCQGDATGIGQARNFHFGSQVGGADAYSSPTV